MKSSEFTPERYRKFLYDTELERSKRSAIAARLIRDHIAETASKLTRATDGSDDHTKP